MFGMQRRWYRFSVRTWPLPAFNLPFLVRCPRPVASSTVVSNASLNTPEEVQAAVPQHWAPARRILRPGAGSHLRYYALSPDRPLLRPEAAARLADAGETNPDR